MRSEQQHVAADERTGVRIHGEGKGLLQGSNEALAVGADVLRCRRIPAAQGQQRLGRRRAHLDGCRETETEKDDEGTQH